MKSRILLCLGWSLLFFAACTKSPNEPVKYVDLRYLAKDTYSLAALDPEPLSIQVKSTYPWEVYNTAPEWVTITPETGAPGELYNVTITYHDNKALDDRIDTLTIKSDYWVGKKIVVFQKGVAYLTTSFDETSALSEKESEQTVAVLSNQKWSAKITSGEEWLKIASKSQGELDGEVTLHAAENLGEQRSGTLTLYDRNGVEQVNVTIHQKGVQLDPDLTYLRTDHTEQQVSVAVHSNTRWTVSKVDNTQEWYTFAKTEYNGNEPLLINFTKNEGSAVRTAVIELSTAAVPGITPVKKQIVIKQANDNTPSRQELDETELAKWSQFSGGKPQVVNGNDASFRNARIIRDNMPIGYYAFRVLPVGKTNSRVFIIQGSNELRLHFEGAKGRIFINPRPWRQGKNVVFDTTKPNIIAVSITKSRTKKGKIDLEYFLNGESIQKMEAFDMDPETPFSIIMGADNGTAIFDYYEYSAPIKWGDE